jgi:hypothetical protein
LLRNTIPPKPNLIQIVDMIIVNSRSFSSGEATSREGPGEIEDLNLSTRLDTSDALPK